MNVMKKYCFDHGVNTYNDETVYYCYLCDEEFDGYNNDLKTHVASGQHRRWEHDIFGGIDDYRLTMAEYSACVSNAISKTGNYNVFFCQICICNVSGSINLWSHILGQRHISNKEDLQDQTYDLIPNLIYPERGGFYCYVCDWYIRSSNQISYHIEDWIHVDNICEFNFSDQRMLHGDD